MKKIFLVVLGFFPVAVVCSQQSTPAASSSPTPIVSHTTAATAADVEALRQQVQILTETVKTLQQEVKDQQAALEKANLTAESGLPENPEPSPISGAEESPAPSGTAAAQFPTEDSSVVSIPPSPSHLAEVIAQMKAQHIKAIIVEPFHDRRIAEKVAGATGAKVVEFSQFPGGQPGTDSYVS